MRIACVTAAVAAGLLLGAATPARATHDLAPQMVMREATSALGNMTYHVYAPHLDGRVPLFVHIHGGNNSAVDAAHRSRLNQLASEHGFVVAYPQEDPGSNAGIWDPAAAAAQGRENRGASLVAQVTREVMAAYPIDSRRVYVGGISAGAGMAIVMAAQYPDLYTALQAEVGDRYGDAALDEWQAGHLVYTVMGERARRIPMVLSYGTLDPFHLTADQESVLAHWLIAHDWMDDGAANGSVPLVPAATRQGFEGKAYSVDTYVDADGCVLAERWLIEGLLHAYSGGDQTAIYDVITDPNAPHMREHAYAFFSDQYDADGAPGCKAAPARSSGGSLDPFALALLLALALLRRGRLARASGTTPT